MRITPFVPTMRPAVDGQMIRFAAAELALWWKTLQDVVPVNRMSTTCPENPVANPVMAGAAPVSTNWIVFVVSAKSFSAPVLLLVCVTVPAGVEAAGVNTGVRTSEVVLSAVPMKRLFVGAVLVRAPAVADT